MFRLFSKIQFPLYSPDDNPGNGGGNAAIEDTHLSTEDMVEFLGDDDNNEIINLEEGKGKDKEEKIDDKTGKTKDKKDSETTLETREVTELEPEIDELEELEKELHEPTEDDLELVTPVRRKDILAKYPTLFKEFPYLEKAYYREQQFTEIFPTIDDARTASEKSQTLDNFEQDVMGGDISVILKTVKEGNPNGFNKIADRYLSTLADVDEKAYFHILGNIGKMTIASMVQEARRSNNEKLQEAAHILNQFMFGTSEYTPPSRLSRDEKPEDNNREKEISEREQQFITRQFESARNDLNTRVNNTLRNTIEANIDPKESMSEYVKKNAVRDAMDTLDRLINQDARFKSLVDKLWDRAFQTNFSRDSVDKIRSAYTSKAKTLLPSVIKRARNEGLRGMGKRVRDEEDTIQTRNKGPVTGGRPSTQQSKGGKITKATDIPKGMSTLEFLNSE